MDDGYTNPISKERNFFYKNVGIGSGSRAMLNLYILFSDTHPILNLTNIPFLYLYFLASVEQFFVLHNF